MAEQKKKLVMWADGCFDMMHYGHANALRQARELGDKLIVGVHSDAEIERNKGPTVMKEDERYEAVRACRWVDEVVENAPYVTKLSVLDEHNVDFCVHGEDVSLDEHGRDTYQDIKDAGRFQVIRRTSGVSSTDMVGRMLLLTKEHHKTDVDTSEFQKSSPYTRVNRFIPTSRRISEFSAGLRSPTEDDVIVYVDGAFDLFHVGHIGLLRKAKELGTYLIVGIHEDEVVNLHKGSNYPIMNVHERVLSVLSCRYVDEVIIGAPYIVDKELIESMRINYVVHGTVPDSPSLSEVDPYAVPKEMGIYREIESPRPDLTTTAVVARIIENRLKFEERNKKKQAKEIAHIESSNQ